MSWLVATCFPGLLMLSTYGLQRLESVIGEAAPFSAPEPPVRNPGFGPGLRLLAEEPGLPTRLCPNPEPNRQFQPTGYANRV